MCRMSMMENEEETWQGAKTSPGALASAQEASSGYQIANHDDIIEQTIKERYI